jgi:hypothetical protein
MGLSAVDRRAIQGLLLINVTWVDKPYEKTVIPSMVLPGPNPQADPYGYVNEKVSEGIQAISDGIRQTGYDITPDYGKVQVNLPGLFSFEGSMSKDLRFYAGGGKGIGDSKSLVDQLRSFNFVDGSKPTNVGIKPGVQFSLGFFTSRMDEGLRDSAMTGTSGSATAPLTAFGIPIGVGGSQNLPQGGGNIFAAPSAIELGTPTSAGVQVSGSTEVLTNFSDTLRRAFDRRPLDRQP